MSSAAAGSSAAAAGPSAAAAGPPPMPPKVLIAIVTDGRADMSLQCCVSILQTQVIMMTSSDPARQFVADLAFVKDLNEALDKLHRDRSLEAAFIIRHDTGVPGEFVTTAFASGESLVISPAPLPTVDWDRVKKHVLDAGEDMAFSGNVYNVKLGGLPRTDGYARVAGIAALSALFVRRHVVDDIATAHPSVIAEPVSAFAVDTVRDGTYVSALDSFVRACGTKKMWADIKHQANTSGPLEYVGCVGSRRTLR